MKIKNNVFFVLVMVMSYGYVFAMKHSDQEEQTGESVANPYFYSQVQQYYGPQPRPEYPKSHSCSAPDIISILANNDTMIQAMNAQKELLAQVVEQKLRDQEEIQRLGSVSEYLRSEVMEAQNKIITLQKKILGPEQLKDFCTKQEKESLMMQIQFLSNSIERIEKDYDSMKKELEQIRNKKAPAPVFNINTSGGTATSSSNPTTTTTQETEVKVENNFNLEWDSKMQLRSAVLLTALLFGFGLSGRPEGGGLAFFVAAAMLCAVHSIQNKMQILGGFALLTVSSAIATVQSKDKDAIKLAAALCAMSCCGTVLVGVLAP